METTDSVARRVSVVPEYRLLFKRVFGNEGVTIDTIAKAIASYERTLLSGNAPFDRFISGDGNAINESQRRGWELFKTKAKCVECHVFTAESPFFIDFRFHNTGIAGSDALFDTLLSSFQSSSAYGAPGETPLQLSSHSEGSAELGRFAVTLKSTDVGAFKTPTLRDIELTSPYMHDGSVKTLIDVVRFYNRGGNPNSHLDERMRPLNLSVVEMNDLVEFLRSLTSDDVLKRCQTTTPQNRNPVPLPK